MQIIFIGMMCQQSIAFMNIGIPVCISVYDIYTFSLLFAADNRIMKVRQSIGPFIFDRVVTGYQKHGCFAFCKQKAQYCRGILKRICSMANNQTILLSFL